MLGYAIVLMLMPVEMPLMASARVQQPDPAPERSGPPPPHPGGLPPPPPPSPWDNPELGARIDQLHSEYRETDLTHTRLSLEATRLIEAIPPSPDEATLRAAYGKLRQIEDQLDRLRTLSVDVHALALSSDMSLEDAHRVAWKLHVYSISDSRNRAELNELKARLEAAIKD